MIKYSLDKNNTGIDVSKHLYGLFFEDINQAADGGLNAEMVINNSFEFEYLTYDDFNCTVPIELRKRPDMYWDIFGAGPKRISNVGGLHPNNPTYLELHIGGHYTVENPGYKVGNDFDLYGMAITVAEKYNFSMYVKPMGFAGTLKVYIRDERKVISTVAKFELSGNDHVWKKIEGQIEGLETKMGRLVMVFEGNGVIGLDYVSLIPDDVWGDPDKYRNGKLSKRIVEVLKDCHPSFFRFPGGCVVEGDHIFENQYRWRNTVGPLIARKQIANTWHYMQSYGVGFYEYFCLCEDLNMTPLPVLHAGLLCQIRMGEQRGMGYKRIMPGTAMFKWEVIDNAAHLLYFAKGDVDSCDPHERYWANVRKDMGHPAPFEMPFIGIGNENWGEEYFENFNACLIGLKQYDYCGKMTNLLEKFDVTVITTAGVSIYPQDSNPNWKIINEKYRDMIVDEHVYNSFQWMIDNSKRYDSYDRDGAKVFMGEYAMHTMADGRGRLNGENNLRSALAEAVFLTGCERNSDVVKMTCYAPLFASTANYRWTPDMIWFNPRDIMLTPNYYVQQMYAKYTGKHLLDNVSYVDPDNAGGISIGGHATETAVRSVTVKDVKTGEVIYYHNFKDGMGDWKVFPRCIGGEIVNGELIIKSADAFNGFYYDAQKFSDCEVEVDFRRVSGKQSFIVAVGVAGVKDMGTMDCYAYSVSCQYGKNHKSYDVSFDKRVDYIRTVCELMGKENFYGYSPEGNKIKLTYTQNKLIAHFFIDGEWHKIMDKNIWKVNERVFQTATYNDDGEIFLKVVNVTGEEQDLEVDISNFGEKTMAKIEMLEHPDENVINEIGTNEGVTYNIQPHTDEVKIENNVLKYKLKVNSLTIFQIK